MHQILREGGGIIWSDTSDYEQTPEMVAALRNETEKYLKEIGSNIYVIGSSYNPWQKVFVNGNLVGYWWDEKFYKPDPTNSDEVTEAPMPKGAQLVPNKSGDLDVLTELELVNEFFKTKVPAESRKALATFLNEKGIETRTISVTVHARIPFKGKFYQVDIKPLNNAPEIAEHHRHRPSFGSPYKGVHKQMMMNALATSQGLLWSPDEALYDRDPVTKKKGKLLARGDMNKIAKILLGPSATEYDLGNFNTIKKAIKDNELRKKVIDMARSSPSWQAATPTVTEWFRRAMDLLK